MGSERRRALIAGGLLVLLALAALALGGTLPEYTPPRPRSPQTGPAGAIVVLVLAVIALAILLFGLIAALRRGAPAATTGDVSGGREIEIGRPTRRQIVIAVVVVLAVLGLFVALGAIRAGEPSQTDQQRTTPSSDDDASGGEAAADESQAAEPPTDDNILDVVALAGVAVVAVSLVGVAVLAARSRPEVVVGEQASRTSAAESSATVSESLARAAELGLAEMADPGRDPREAIIACYAAMESALADAPDVAPRASDTPSEVLERAVGHGVLRTGAAAELVELFTEARFSPHRMGEADRASATRQLRAVLDDVRAVQNP
ncbi:DUF4129 domain-containing protein [Aldersonia kunmingensis]|uniref:DUF4129 domain-containing protein n=1 Tax=Aldersonia kunmingensis TaxID=408066 RepID=UPI000835A39B|nr:DUF4129 domain-containing protein [Aldersonia kunmingensis]